MVTKPANAEEAIRQYEQYRANREKQDENNEPIRPAGPKPHRIVRINGWLKTPGRIQYQMRGLSFTVEEEIPADRKRSDIVREMCQDLGPLVLEFEPRTPTTNSNVPIPKSAPAPSEPTPELDPAYLDTLGWRDFSPGPGQWIVADTSGAQAIDDELTRSGQTIVIGTYRYRLSFGRPDKEGKRCKFVNRYPVK